MVDWIFRDNQNFDPSQPQKQKGLSALLPVILLEFNEFLGLVHHLFMFSFGFILTQAGLLIPETYIKDPIQVDFSCTPESSHTNFISSFLEVDLSNNAHDEGVNNNSKAPTPPSPHKLPSLKECLRFGDDQDAWLDFRVMSFLQTLSNWDEKDYAQRGCRS